MQLIDQGEDDRQARMIETHAVVQIAGQRYAGLVDLVEHVALIVAVRRDHAFLDPGQQHLERAHDLRLRFCLRAWPFPTSELLG